MRYWLLPCTKTKLNHPAPARDLYSASEYWCCLHSLFLAVKDHETKDDWIPGQCHDRAFVVSAKHGLLPLDSDWKIAPYELSVKDLNPEELKDWANRISEQLIEQSQREPWGGTNWNKRKPMKVVWLLPKSYQKHLLPIFDGDWDSLPEEIQMMNNHSFPFHGLAGIGAIKKYCVEKVKNLGGQRRRPPLRSHKKKKEVVEEVHQLSLFGGSDACVE